MVHQSDVVGRTSDASSECESEYSVAPRSVVWSTGASLVMLPVDANTSEHGWVIYRFLSCGAQSRNLRGNVRSI